MKTVTNIIDHILKVIIVVIMIAISILGIYQVVTRYFLGNASTWSEEMIRFLFIWASCLGGAVGIKEKIHIGIDVVVGVLPNKVRKITDILVYLLIITFGVFLTIYGFKLSQQTMSQVSPALGVSMGIVYLALPALGILSIYYSLLELISLIKSKEGVE